MKRSEFAAKTTQEKIEYLSNNNRTVFDLLKVDISSLEDQKLIYLYDLSETYTVISDQTKEVAAKLDHVSKTAAAQFKDALEATGLSQMEKTVAVEIFKAVIVPAVNSCSKYLREGYKKANTRFYEGLAAVGTVGILEKMIEFRNQIDKRFPGTSDMIISAAGAGLTGLVAAYWPTAAETLKTFKLVENVQSFLKVESLESTIKNLNDKFDEIKKDKQLAEIHKTGEKIAELATITKVPIEALQKIGFNLESVEKTITQARTNEASKEFIKYLGSTADKMPATSEDLSKHLQQLEASLIKSASNNLNAEDIKKFEAVLSVKMQEVEKTYAASFEKDKNIYEKLICAQNSSNILTSAINDFKNKLPSTSQNRASTEAFAKEAKSIIKEELPNLTHEITRQAKKAPILAKELGLDLKMELKVQQSVQQGVSR